MDVGFIPGIYNYCDRWCEKCEQQLRCMSFVMGKKIEEKGGFNFEREGHREDESIWARLKEVFESTYEVLHELAEERGLDVEDIYASENIDREFWGEDYEGTPREQVYQKLESSDLLRICSIYEYWADKCLEQLYEIINDKEKNELLEEALEVVGWYPDLIQAKIRRALYGYHYHTANKSKTTEDYNGSAKVALIGVERSIENWKIIQPLCPAYQKEISHLLVVLEQLRSDADEYFRTPRVRQLIAGPKGLQRKSRIKNERCQQLKTAYAPSNYKRILYLSDYSIGSE